MNYKLFPMMLLIFLSSSAFSEEKTPLDVSPQAPYPFHGEKLRGIILEEEEEKAEAWEAARRGGVVRIDRVDYAVIMSKYFDINLGSDEKKPSPKRVIFTREHLQELFPDSTVKVFPKSLQQNYVAVDDENHVKNQGESTGKIAKDRPRTECIQLAFRKSPENTEFSQRFHIDVVYYTSEKESRNRMFQGFFVTNPYGVVQTIQAGIRPAPELNIGDLCIVWPDHSKNSFRQMNFIRDCTTFCILSLQNHEVPAEIAKKLDESFVKLNKELNASEDDAPLVETSGVSDECVIE